MLYTYEQKIIAYHSIMQKLVAYTVTLIFAVLILRSLGRLIRGPVVEGATGSTTSTTYTDPGLSSDPLYLATLNAANISYLKGQIDDLISMKSSFQSLSDQVDSNSTNIQALNQAVQSTQDSVPDSDTTSALADTGNTTPPGAA